MTSGTMQKVVGSNPSGASGDELFVNIYLTCVCPMFSMRAFRCSVCII